MMHTCAAHVCGSVDREGRALAKNNNVTIKEIARRAGVSHSTVSRALNNHPAIAPETVERIRQLADELRYVPSGTARSLKTNRTYVLGVIVGRIADPFYSEVLDGIQSVLPEAGYSLVVSAFEYDPKREISLLRAMVERRIDALIISSSHFTQERLERLGGFPMPTIFIHNRAEDVLPHSIYHDDLTGTRTLANHLLELGHQRIAFVGNQRGGLLHQQRREGLVVELRARGLSLEPAFDLMAPTGQLESGAAAGRQLLQLAERPTAVMCFNDMQAIGLMQVLQEAGLPVPEAISVVGFDDIALASLVCPPLTTFHQPKRELGQLAAQLALRLVKEAAREGEPESERHLMLGRLVVRRSTARVPAARS